MLTIVRLFTLLSLVCFLTAPPASAQIEAPPLDYVAVPDDFSLPPNMSFGSVSGVAINSKGNIFVLARDANPDIMDAHLTGHSRSIPVIIVLDDAYEERGWWGPRPTALQRWVSGQGQLLEKSTRYREARTWYARDRGRTTLEEVVSMLERAAAARVGTI